jgi:phage tail sheath protein FI
MVCVPDLVAAFQQGSMDLDAVKGVQEAIVNHCSNLKDRMAILDSPPGLNPQQVKDWQAANANFDSAFAALYYPWIEVADPVTGENIEVPPCGHMAGIWSRSDDTRGVFKAPANEPVRGALDLATQVTRGEQDLLNPAGINVIRTFPGRGIRVWGARTLSSDSTWQYLNVRRLFNYIEESILEGTEWVVFEPNDQELWQRIKRTIAAFLTGLWRDGALFGATPEQAFYVKCDEETNPSDIVEAGQVVVEIGIAPVRPAEFVVINIRQLLGGGQVTE